MGIFFEILFFVLRLRPPPPTVVVAEVRLPTPVTDGIARRGGWQPRAAKQQALAAKGFHTPRPVPALKVRLMHAKGVS